MSSTSASPVIELVQVSKSFGKPSAAVQALRNVDVQVDCGEVLGLIGPNGAGKTTAMRILMGYLTANSGQVRVLGGESRDVQIRRLIGYLPGDFKLGDRGKVSSILQDYATLRGCSLDYAKQLAERLNLDTSRKFHTLSKGNRQKVGLVQAFMHQPQVVVLDEPTSGLDPLAQRTVVELVAERRDAGAAVLFSSHILSEVEDVAQRVTILRRGEVVTTGATVDLARRTAQRLDVYFTNDVDYRDLQTVPEVHLEAFAGNHAVFVVTGNLDPLIALLAQHSVARLETARHDLDDIFFEYYLDQPTNPAGSQDNPEVAS